MSPLRYLLTRLALAPPTLLGVAIIAFVVLRVVPGDPIAMMTPPGATEADVARLRALYGLDRDILTQFAIWIGAVPQGDFGTSISLRADVLGLVAHALPATIELCLMAILIAILAGGSLAVLGAWRRGAVEAAIDAAIAVVQAIPDFLWALILVLAAVLLAGTVDLPISMRVDPRLELDNATRFLLAEHLLRGRFDVVADLLAHIVLPAAALALPLTAVIARVLKASLVEAMAQDYVLMARVKGHSRAAIILGHALRNALVPTVTLTGVQFTFLVGGTVLVEKIFSYPGIGWLAIDAVINRDLPLIQGLVLTFAALFILVNLLVDLSYALLNPRLRHG
jgi:ABC-type dipeptide/oligopeptide/nickel transport system permease component